MTMFMLLSSWHCHCQSSPGSFDEYSTGGCQLLDPANELEPQIHLDWQLYYYYCTHHHHLLLLSLKTDTRFTIPRSAEGWVDLAGWFHTEMVYLPQTVLPSQC